MKISKILAPLGGRTVRNGALALVAATALAASAQAQTKVRVTLDWVPQSTHGPTFIAQYQGYFKAEGLDVSITPGKGSADAVRKLVAGTHDIGWPDINALIEFNSKNPDQAIKTIMMLYEQPPFSICVLVKSGIKNPKQLVGRSLGAPVFDASYKLFPAFAAAIGIDPNSVKKKNMNPRLREPMLIRGDVDSISGHVFSSLLAIKAAGLKESDVDCFMYGDHGMEAYANGIAVSPKFAAAHPEAVKGFIRATYKAARDMVQRPQMAVDAVKKFQPLVQASVEADRLRIAMDCCILTPNVKKNGYGNVDMARLQRSINQAAAAYKLKNVPKAADMFDASFLPPQAERFIHK
ncbi:MAG: ABC transporter substrate-binding protein [Alphaproteobacteria bacterium]|jgi:NitT/TauT family transport system substrate-binding protein|nr:ABC transporter substrate-binding protein [Alphaproteobacteria bacterium]